VTVLWWWYGRNEPGGDGELVVTGLPGVAILVAALDRWFEEEPESLRYPGPGDYVQLAALVEARRRLADEFPLSATLVAALDRVGS